MEKHIQQYLDEIVSSKNAGDKFIVALVNNVKDVHTANRYGDTLLHVAARHGSPSIVNVLLSLGAQINIKNINGVTPLHLAAEHGNQGVFELLLDKGADINVLNNKYRTPLHLAVENLDLYSVIKILLIKGINLNTINLYSVPLLHWVIENGDISTLELLLNNGAEANTTNDKGESALYKATNSRKTSHVKLLLEKGANITVAHGEIPLHLAAMRGDIDIIELLLDAGSNINITNGIRNTALHWAVQFGNQSTVQLLLKKGADVNRRNIDGDTALHFAVNEKNIATINLLIKYNAKVNVTNEAGNTLLHLAAKNTDLRPLDLLLKEDAKVNVTDMDGNSPLHIAAQSGNTSMLEILLNSGGNINFNNKDGRSPLHCAVLGGNISNIVLLINKGAEINNKDYNGDTLLHCAAKLRDASILELLLNQGMDINMTNNYGDSPLYIAVANDNMPIIELLLIRDAEVNITNTDGYSPLYLAVHSAILPIVELLLDNGSVVTEIIHNGRTLLHAAALSGCLSIVELLLSKGVNVNVTDKSGNTALHFAVNSEIPFVVDALLNKGAAVNVTNKVGDSPLHLAAIAASTRSVHMNSIDNEELQDAMRQKFMVNLLLDRAIDVNMANNHGDMALHLAAKSGLQYFVEMLLKEGAVVNTANKNGESPLYLAVHSGDVAIVNMLLNKHANVHTPDKYGNTPLHLAAFYNNMQIIKLLLRQGANVRHKNRAGETPGNVAKQYNFEPSDEIINLLLTAEQSEISSVSSKKHYSLGFVKFLRIFQSNGNNLKKIQNNSLRNCIEPKFKYFKKDTSGMCGQLYETKLLSLVLLRVLNDDHIEHFLLGSNIQGIGDMDDICLRFNERGRQTPILLFVQAKHRGDTEKGKLTMENMQSTSGDFSIRKYFESYLKIKDRFREDSKDPMFRGEFKNVECNFVIYTPAKDTIKKKLKQKCNDKVHYLINTGQNTNAFQYEFVEYDVDNLTKISAIARLKRLGALFLDLIMSAKYKPETILTDKLITKYHVVITKEVLQQKHIQQDMKDYRWWEFRPEFLKSKSEYLVILKTTFFKEMLTKHCDQSKISDVDRDNFQLYVENQCEATLSKLIGKIMTYNENNKKMQIIENSAITKLFKGNKLFPFTDILNNININENILNKAIELKLLSLEIKLPLSFGNLDMFFRGNASKVKKRIETVAEKLTSLLETNKNTYVVNITDEIVGPGKTIEKGIIDINGGIGSAVGNLLILDTNTQMLKFDVDNNALPENALLFLNELQNQKFKLDIEILSRYRIKVNIDGFPKGSFHGDEYDKEQVKDFLNKLWIYSEQAQQNEIEQTIKYEINKYYNDDTESNQIKLKIDSHDIFLESHNEIQKWWMLKGEVPYLNRGDDFFKRAVLLCYNNLLLTINNLMHDLDICSVDVKFNTKVKLDNMSLKVDESFYRALSELGGILDTQNKKINIKNKDKKEIVNWLIKSYNDWKNNDQNTNHVFPNNHLVNKTNYAFKKRTGTSAVRGYLYATKMLSLILLRSLSDVNKDIFFLGNNIQEIGAMDDICLRYQAKGQQRPIVLFIQTKHREDTEKGKLTVEDVRSASGDFSLRKCFESYIKIKDHFLTVTEDPIFDGDFSNIECCYVIYTSARECFDKKKIGHKFNDNVHRLINTGRSTADVFQYEHNEEDIDNLTNIIVKKEIEKMILVFLQLIMSAECSSDLILTNNLLARYHVVLAQEVLHLCTPHKKQDFSIWKFRREVFENDCEYMLGLKNTLFENVSTRCYDQSKITNEDINNIKEFQNNPCKSTITKLIGKLATYNEKTRKLQLVETLVLKDTSLEQFNKIEIDKNIIYEAIQDKLLSMEIKLPSSFGNLDMTFRGNEAEIPDRMKTVAKLFIKLLEMNRNKEIIAINKNVSVNTLEWEIINCEITTAIGNLLIYDNETDMLKFNLNKKILPSNAALFLNILIDHCYTNNEEKLNRIRIKVSNERIPKSSFKPNEFDKSHARDLISRLWFYANQAKEDEVERILKAEINKYYYNRTTHKCTKYVNLDNFIYLRSHDTIQNWSIQTNESHYIKRACKLFEDSKLADIYNLLLSVINYLYITSDSRVIWKFNQGIKAVENIKKMQRLFRQMIMSLFKMFDLQPDLLVDIKYPHTSWFLYEHMEFSFSIEIHPELESAVVKMVALSRSGASDFTIIAKAGSRGGRILTLTIDSLTEILVPSTPSHHHHHQPEDLHFD